MNVRIHGEIPEGHISPEFHASIIWRAGELLNNGEDRGAFRVFEDEIIRIVGPRSCDDPHDEKGFSMVIVKPGTHGYRPFKSEKQMEPVTVSRETLMFLDEEIGGGSSRGIYLREDGPLWGVVDDATAAYFPNAHLWPVGTSGGR